MLIFIPVTDYSRDATEAATMSDLDLGSIRIGQTAAFSFRIGNVGDSPESWTLTTSDSVSTWTLPDGGSLDPGETTDTLTAEVTIPEYAIEMAYAVDLVASDGSVLEIFYEAMGTNSHRRTQYPRRAGLDTDNASNVIDALGDILRVTIYDPIAYPGPVGFGVKLKAQSLGAARSNLAGYSPWRILDGRQVCDRLNPNDASYGYSPSSKIIQGQFSRESRTTRYFNLTATDTTMEYQVGASLIFRAEDELIRHWALFENATETDKAQYKRTVLIIARQGELWSIENIRTLDKGDVLSHFEADLVAIHPRNMGKPTFWNPFAITYRLDSDAPYALFPCDAEIYLDDFAGIPSGSGDVSGGLLQSDALQSDHPIFDQSDFVAPPAPEPEPDPVFDTITIPVFAGTQDAFYDTGTPVWSHAASTMAMIADTRTIWLQFISPLPRNTPIQSATLRVTPSSTNIVVPEIFNVNYVDLYQDDLSSDRSAYLSTRDPATNSEVTFTDWTANVAVEVDVTDTIAAWQTEGDVPEDDSGAFLTLVLERGSGLVGAYALYAYDHPTGAPAEIEITYQVE